MNGLHVLDEESAISPATGQPYPSWAGTEPQELDLHCICGAPWVEDQCEGAPMTLTPEHESAIREQWLRQCGPCDAGIPLKCVCPDRDPRSDLAALLAELDRVRAERDANRLQLGKSIHRHADQLLRRAETERDALAGEVAALREQLDKANAFTLQRMSDDAAEIQQLRAQLAQLAELHDLHVAAADCKKK